MLIVRLWGGIGNQLFQYAFGEFLRREFYVDVDYDICSFGHSDKLRSLEIFPFVKEKLPIATSFKIRFSRYRGVLNKLLKFIYLLNPKHKIITENKWEAFCKQGLNISNEYYFQGYWQDEKFASFLLENNLLSINENELPKNLLDVYKDIKDAVEVRVDLLLEQKQHSMK